MGLRTLGMPLAVAAVGQRGIVCCEAARRGGAANLQVQMQGIVLAVGCCQRCC